MNEYETIFIYLNTSHVKVKLMKNIGMDADELYLNTSHVKVKLSHFLQIKCVLYNLNTSHVKVKRFLRI